MRSSIESKSVSVIEKPKEPERVKKLQDLLSMYREDIKDIEWPDEFRVFIEKAKGSLLLAWQNFCQAKKEDGISKQSPPGYFSANKLLERMARDIFAEELLSMLLVDGRVDYNPLQKKCEDIFKNVDNVRREQQEVIEGVQVIIRGREISISSMPILQQKRIAEEEERKARDYKSMDVPQLKKRLQEVLAAQAESERDRELLMEAEERFGPQRGAGGMPATVEWSREAVDLIRNRQSILERLRELGEDVSEFEK